MWDARVHSNSCWGSVYFRRSDVDVGQIIPSLLGQGSMPQTSRARGMPLSQPAVAAFAVTDQQSQETPWSQPVLATFAVTDQQSQGIPLTHPGPLLWGCRAACEALSGKLTCTRGSQNDCPLSCPPALLLRKFQLLQMVRTPFPSEIPRCLTPFSIWVWLAAILRSI